MGKLGVCGFNKIVFLKTQADKLKKDKYNCNVIAVKKRLPTLQYNRNWAAVSGARHLVHGPEAKYSYF